MPDHKKEIEHIAAIIAEIERDAANG